MADEKHWHQTIDPRREPEDVDPAELPAEKQAEIQAQVDEMLRREAAGERVGH